ncbi:ABC transporter permease, partial [Leclercia adecarboxylata]
GLVALSTGAVAVAVVNVAGILQGRASMPLGTWISCALLAVLCTMVFAALGVFVGYLVPGENAMQVLGPGLAILAFLGNVFIPIDDHSSLLWHVASCTPMFGVAEVTRAPLTGELPWYAVANVV